MKKSQLQYMYVYLYKSTLYKYIFLCDGAFTVCLLSCHEGVYKKMSSYRVKTCRKFNICYRIIVELAAR